MATVKRKDLAHSSRFFFVDQQPTAARVDIVAEHRSSTDPFALPACRRHLVARPFTNQIPLKGGKRQKNIKRQPSNRGRGIKLLRDRNEADRALIEPVYHAREVKHRPPQPIPFVTDPPPYLTSFPTA